MERINQVSAGSGTPPLSKSEIESLTGFMDVLIEMDFERQRNEKEAAVDTTIKNSNADEPLAS